MFAHTVEWDVNFWDTAKAVPNPKSKAGLLSKAGSWSRGQFEAEEIEP